MHPAEKWAKNVLNGKIVSCELVKLACQRYFDDLETGVDRGLYFDREAAQRSIKFFGFLKHYKGKYNGKKFELDDWQKFVNWNVFGWKNADGTRRFRYVFVMIPRKNGKTSFAAGEGLYMFIGDGEAAPEIYTCATKLPQAKICFNDAKEMVKRSAALKSRVGVFKHNLHIAANAGKFEPLSSDSDKQDGVNPSCGIIDEYHAHKNDGMFKVLKSGMGAREEPLIFIITTAGFNKQGPCKKYHDIVVKILKGIITQDNLFGMIFTIDKDDDWKDPEAWKKANPSYYSIDTLQKFLEEEYKDAVNNPSMQVNFKTKNLNMWVDSEDVWIEDDKWMKCANENLTLQQAIEKLKGRTCYGGLDLASVEDLSSLVLYFPPENGEPADLLPFFWVPEDTVEKRVDRDDLPYDEWVRDGWIYATPGNIQDYADIRRFISGVFIGDGKQQVSEECIASWFNLISIGFDRYNSSQLVVDLGNDDIKMTKFGQGFYSMSYPTKEFQKEILKEQINHFGNPILRWQVANVKLQRNAAGDIKIDKEKSKDKVDGMVSSVMSYGEYLTAIANDETEAYADHGIRFLED